VLWKIIGVFQIFRQVFLEVANSLIVLFDELWQLFDVSSYGSPREGRCWHNFINQLSNALVRSKILGDIVYLPKLAINPEPCLKHLTINVRACRLALYSGLS
jgi:hypothetical protein